MYEAQQGVSLRDVADRFSVAVSAVHKRVAREGWTAGKGEQLVQQKVAAVRAFAEATEASEQYGVHFTQAVDDIARERTGLQKMAYKLFAETYRRAMFNLADDRKDHTPQDLKAYSGIAGEMAKAADPSRTEVNINQKQPQGGTWEIRIIENGADDPLPIEE
jgi:hypothetical protein